MLDGRLRRLIEPALDRLGRVLAAREIGADAVTLVGFALGLAALPAIAWHHYQAGLALILLNRLADGLDGAIARQAGLTDRGGFLDISLDFVFYATVPFAFALAEPAANALPAAFLLFSFIGTGSSFLAFAIIAAKRDIATDLRGKKSFYYLGGLTEGSETILLFVLACLLPGWFPALAWGFGALCWLTTATRLVAGWQTFRQP